MTQPQRGSARSGVNDLRNIVERLDSLMGSSAGGRSEAQDAQLDAVLLELGDRITALEGALEELRTLVNHLMTIATWQAKVTATLVEEETEDVVGDAADDAVVYEDADEAQQPDVRHETVTVPAHYFEREEASGEPSSGHPRQGGAPQHGRPLDDDIDDILGTNRDAGGGHPPPPDFGI